MHWIIQVILQVFLEVENQIRRKIGKLTEENTVKTLERNAKTWKH